MTLLICTGPGLSDGHCKQARQASLGTPEHYLGFLGRPSLSASKSRIFLELKVMPEDILLVLNDPAKQTRRI